MESAIFCSAARMMRTQAGATTAKAQMMHSNDTSSDDVCALA
jgi:hypothetical protein